MTYKEFVERLAAILTVSDVRQGEDALRKSQARLRAIFESATDAILTTDETQTIVTVNPAAAEIFRCAREDMVGSPLERFIPERFRTRHRHDMQKLGEAVVSSRHMGGARDVKGLRGDGEEFPIDVSISHLNLDGQLLYTAVLRDITGRRRIEGELRAGKAMLEAALSSMSDAVVICDAQGDVIQLNDAFAGFYRFDTKDDCPQALTEYPDILEMFMPNGDLAPLEQWAVVRALRGESASNTEYKLRRKDTGQSWIGSYSFAPVRSEDGTIVGAVVTARDVTETKQRQAELAFAHADLQRLIEAKDKVQEEERKRIARDLHDDLQQTLAAIRIDVGAIEQKLAADVVALAMLAKVDELASTAILSVRRIVNDLQPQVLEDLGLVPALHAMAAEFSRRTGIGCEIDALDTWGNASAELTSIASSLYRITQEALNNVVKHAQASAVHLRLGIEGDGDLVLRICDNGRGMSVADRHKVQSFGLLGMQERVRALGGTLRIESQRGAGTTIEVAVALPDSCHPALAPRMGLAPALTPTFGRAPSRPDLMDQATAGARGLTGTESPSIQEAIDATPGNIAVLDLDGVIRYVNRAWRAFAERNGDPEMIGTGPGVNYLAVCRRSAEQDEHAGQVLKGLLDVLNGKLDEFMAAYPCHSPHEQRWFLVQIAPTAGGNVRVTHQDVRHLTEVVRPTSPG